MNNDIELRDMYLISYLELQGLHFRSVVKKGNVYFFKYLDSQELNEASELFLTGKALVNPLEYNLKIRAIRRLVYE